MCKLSILICTVPTRINNLKILQQVYDQSKRHGRDVQVLYLGDNFYHTTGHKRNVLKYMTEGERLLYWDDDDIISDDAIDILIDACNNTDADVINYGVEISINGKEFKPVDYSISHKKDATLPYSYVRLPNHLMCWKKSIADMVDFKDQTVYEDAIWARDMRRYVKNEYKIDKTLYFYYSNFKQSEALKRRKQ